MGFQWFSCFNESSQLVELIRVDPFGSSAALLRLTFQSKASMACGTKQPAKRNQTIYTNESWEWDGISLIFWRSTLIIHLIRPYYISYNILSLHTLINIIYVLVCICMKFYFLWFTSMHFSFDQSVPVFLAGIDMNQGGPGSQPACEGPENSSPIGPKNPSNFRISFHRKDALKNNTSSQLVFLPQISKSGDS